MPKKRSLRRPDILKRDDDIRQWVKEHRSKTFMCKSLNCRLKTLNYHLERLGLYYRGTSHQRTDILDRRSEIERWIFEGQSKAFICQQFKCRPDTLESYLKKMGIEYDGNMGGAGFARPSYRKTHAELSPHAHSAQRREVLIREGLKERRCEGCGGVEWLGYEMPLELDHIDGNSFNNEIENLRILCPNCHTLLGVVKWKNGAEFRRT